MTCSFRILWTN